MRAVRRVPQKLRQFESIRELQHAIAGGIDVIHREVPIDGILQLRFADGVGIRAILRIPMAQPMPMTPAYTTPSSGRP
jgi:hypothetical protein